MHYDLKITKEQAEIIKKALDLFSRIGTGQFEEILRHPTWDKKLLRGEITHSTIAHARIDIDKAKQLITGFKPSVSISIAVADEPNRIAYDVFQVIANTLWQNSDNKENTADTVNALKPIKLSDHQLPEMNKCNQ